MKRELDLGFVALTDAAPLIVARELGLFADEGLDVALHREVSWATIRDKVAAGLYQGAHMLAPMALAANLGAGSERFSLIAPLSLNAHGAAIGVSRDLAGEMAAFEPDNPLSAFALRGAVADRARRGVPLATFAVVFPYSMHAYMLRYWAASAGIDPDRDLRIVVAAPTAIAERLKSGEIDGFCVGAPWGTICEIGSGAKIALEGSAFWPGGPDKVLGLSQAWVEREKASALALIRAVLRAALWADAPENRADLARLLAQAHYVGAPAESIARKLGEDGLRFARCAACFPWLSHARWILTQMLRWGEIAEETDLERAASVYRPDLFRAAAASLSLSAPLADAKIEGAHGEVWALPGTRGPIPMAYDRFFDDSTFDPAQARRYAAASAITRVGRTS